ncbi:hypothetical protein D3C76_1419920 [compost metagenome]
MLGGNLRQQIRFQPRCERQAVVHHDLFAQCLQGAQGAGEAIITVRPPTNAAEAFRVEAGEGGLQGLVAGQDFVFGALCLQGAAQLRGGLSDSGLNAIKRGHRSECRRRWLAIGFSRAPTGGTIALSGEKIVQRIEREQLAYPGAFAADQAQFVAVVQADHPQAAGQWQDKQ